MMTDVNATELLIDTNAREKTTGTRGHDHAAEVLAEEENREPIARAPNIRHTAVLNLLLPNAVEMANETTRVLIVLMAVDMVVGAQTI